MTRYSRRRVVSARNTTGGMGVTSPITLPINLSLQQIDSGFTYVPPVLVAPSITGNPTIAGSAIVGQTLTATAAPSSGDPSPTRTWSWLRSGVAIPSAASTSYTLTVDDIGATIQAVQTETNAAGTATATSAAVGPVTDAAGSPLSLMFNTDTYSDGTHTAFGDIFDFTRSGSATYMDSNGQMQTAADGVARRNHHIWNGAAWVSDGLLLETDSATNEIPESVPTETAWFNLDGTLTDNATIAPDGTSTAAKFVEDATNAVHRQDTYATGTTHVDGNRYVGSIWLKAGERDQVLISRLGSNQQGTISGGGWSADVDLTAGTITSTGTACGITPYSNGWYRVWVAWDCVSNSGSTRFLMYSKDGSGNTSYLGDGTSGYYLWGGQIEQTGLTLANAPTFPSSYIPTSGSTVTRASEALEVKAASIPVSATGQTMVIKAKIDYADDGSNHTARLLARCGASAPYAYIGFGTVPSFTGYVVGEMKNASTLARANYNSTTDSYTPGRRVAISAGIRFNSSGYIEAAADGTTLAAPTTVAGAYPDLSGNPVELFGSGSTKINGTIQSFEMWDSDIGTSELETRTAA